MSLYEMSRWWVLCGLSIRDLPGRCGCLDFFDTIPIEYMHRIIFMYFLL